jgi:transcriptional regulator with XRE-family HTH domain
VNDILSDKKLKTIHSIVAMNVRKQRGVVKMSQLSLAVEMGHKSVGLVSFAEAGINNKHFNIEHLATIAKILDIPITDLFEGVDQILKKSEQKFEE